jgi:peptidyl-prolyl cis-trans isomerase C
MSKPLFPDVFVNGEMIVQADVAAEAQNHNAPEGKPGLAWRKAAQALVIRKLLLQEAQRQGLVAEPAARGAGRVETEEEALIRALLEDRIDVTPPSEDAVRAVWQASPERFVSPALWEVSHILCAANPGDETSVSKAKLRADVIAATLRDDPKGFGRMAKEHSDCDSRANRGALGQLGPGDTVPEFEAALVDLPEGAMTPTPVRTRFGFHLIRMDARAEGKPLPFEAVKPKITEALEKAEWARAAKAFADALVANAKIEGLTMGAL